MKTEGKARLTQHRVPEGEFNVAADMTLLAMGFTGPEENPVFKELKIGHNTRTLLERDSRGRAGPGIYVAGDAVTGQSLVVKPLANDLAVAGTALARCRDEALAGTGALPEGVKHILYEEIFVHGACPLRV